MVGNKVSNILFSKEEYLENNYGSITVITCKK